MANSVIVKIDGDDRGFESVMSGIGKTAKKGLGLAVKGAAAATAGIAALTTMSVKGYAEYEQLVGGVETLFKDSAGAIKGYADEAYKTSGLSANEYMSTVTSFSASLLQSLNGDTAKSADYANQAIIDMSDNANKMGTDMEMIQNAYQGFAKQNYTMLDNLKLGYGGTKEEMQRLLDDASKISGIKYDISSFADVTEAIHVIQTEMGITGTTAKEASTTIQGSFGMLKSSLDNLMTGLADPSQNLDVLIDNVINSAITLLGNLTPVIETILESVPKMINTLGTKLLESLPGLVNQLLPSLADTASQLLTVLATSLSNNAETIGQTALSVLMTLVNTILDNLPMLIETALTLIMTLAEGLTQALPELMPAVVDTVIKIVDTLLDNIDMLVDVAIDLILALADGWVTAVPKLIEKIPEIIIKIVKAIIKNAPQMYKAAKELISKLWSGLIEAYATYFKSWGNVIYDNIIQPIKDKIIQIIEVGKNLVSGLWNGINGAKDWLIGKVKEWCGSLLDGIKAFFGIHSPSRVMRDEVGKMITTGIAVGIDEGKTEVQKVMDSLNKELLESEKKYLDESERLKDSKSDADKKYLEELKEIADKERKIYDASQKDIEKYKESIVDNFKEMSEQAIDSIEDLATAQEKLSKKLSNFGGLTDEIKIEGTDYSYHTLTNLDSEIAVLENYRRLLREVQALDDGSEGFDMLYDEILSMNRQDAINTMSAVANEKDLSGFLAKLSKKAELSAEIAKEAYGEDFKELKTNIENTFGTVPEDFFDIGEDSAKQFGDGFMEQLKATFEKVKTAISANLATITPNITYAGGHGGTTNNYSATYNILPSKGESTQEQTKAIKDFNTRNEMAGGY